MLTSIGIVLLCGLGAAFLAEKLQLPRLVGMIAIGVLLGPYGMDWLAQPLLTAAPDLRQIALIIILLRVGLALDTADLRRIGRPAFLMSWLPASAEIIGIVVLAPPLLGISYLDAAIAGSVVAAVSPAVIVPRMLQLMQQQRGTAKCIPQLIMAGASIDDIFVIVLFSAFTGMALHQGGAAGTALQIPLSIAGGIAAGIAIGWLLLQFFRRFQPRDSVRVILLLSLAFLLPVVENQWRIPCSALLATLCAGLTLRQWAPEAAERLCVKFGKLWIAAEVVLFVLVGAALDWRYAWQEGGMIVLLVVLALLFRMAGVWLCLWKTPLNFRERVFCMLAYIPKATVQAAIGAVPLALGLGCGPVVLAIAVVSILLTAPLGAFAIDRTHPYLLN